MPITDVESSRQGATASGKKSAESASTFKQPAFEPFKDDLPDASTGSDAHQLAEQPTGSEHLGPESDSEALASSEACTSITSEFHTENRPISKMRVVVLLFTAVMLTGLIAFSERLIYFRLSPFAKELLGFLKNLTALGAAMITAVALFESWKHPKSAGKALLVAGISATLGLTAKILEPPPTVSPDIIHRLVNFNAEKYGAVIPPDMEEIVKAIDLTDQDPLRLAQSKLAVDRIDEALRLFNAGLAKQTDTERYLADAHAGKGLALAQKNKLDEALFEAERSFAITPNLPAILLRCSVLRRLARTEEALTVCSDATRLYPTSPRSWGEKGGVLIALGLSEHDLKPSLYEEAIAALDISINGAPSNPSSWNNKAIALHHLRRNAEALIAVDQAIALKPDFEDALLNKGTILKALKRPQDAMDLYADLIRRNPNDDYAWNNLGDGYELKGQLDEALAAYDAALQINPTYGDALFNKGEVLIRLKRFSEGASDLTKAVRVSPKDYEAFYQLAIALEATGDQQGALAAVTTSVKINPSFPPATKLRVRLENPSWTNSSSN